MKIYFIRHGLSVMNKQNLWSGQTNTPLAPEGHEQANRAGTLMAQQGLKFDVIVSSPLDRAIDTATYISKKINYNPDSILINELFKERNFGELEGTSKFSLSSVAYALNESFIDRYSGAETYKSLQERAQDASALLNQLDAKSVLVVAHGAFGRALFTAVTGQSVSIRNVRHKNATLVRFV